MPKDLNVFFFCSASADGRICVRKILEGNGEDGKLTDQVLLAIQIIGEWEMCHPRLCWHSHMQVFSKSFGLKEMVFTGTNDSGMVFGAFHNKTSCRIQTARGRPRD